jgi:DNA-binding MarR family transcriptional regulator
VPARRRNDAASEAEAHRLAEELRQSVGGFVRAVRQQSGTRKSAQSETLDMLDRRGPMNVAELAEARGVTHQTMRIVVAQLQEAGLVTQEPDPTDKRSRSVSLTSAGHDTLVQERLARTSHIAGLIRSRLSAEECDVVRAAAAILARLASPAS